MLASQSQLQGRALPSHSLMSSGWDRTCGDSERAADAKSWNTGRCFWHATSSVSANALNARPSGHNGRPVARTRAVVFATAINTDSSSSARRDFGYVGTCRNMGWDALQTQCQPSSDVAERLIARDVHGVEVFHGNGCLCPRLCTSPRGARISVQLWSRIDCPRLQVVRRNHFGCETVLRASSQRAKISSIVPVNIITFLGRSPRTAQLRLRLCCTIQSHLGCGEHPLGDISMR